MINEMTEDETCYEVLQDSGIFVLSGNVNAQASTAVIKWVLESNLDTRNLNHLTLILNSPGGELPDAFAIIDIMNSSKIPINTVGLGQVCSSGFLIFINGKHRTLTPNTCVMSHPYSWDVSGQHNELVEARKEQDLMQDRMVSHISKCTKLNKMKVTQYLLKTTDAYLNTKECLEYGICDEIKKLKT